MSESEPHFTARHFIDYICDVRKVSRSDFTIRPDVILSYVGNLATQASLWSMEPIPVTILPGPIFSNQTATLLKGPIGAPLAASTMEELAELGARRLWVLGYAGSLDARYPLGSVVGVNQAWSDEGTSPHYGSHGWGKTDRTMTEHLLRVDPNLPFGSIWSTDAIYRETAQKIQYFTNMGCDLVDMETSCYCHVAPQLGLSVAAVMVISDELFHPWMPGFGSKPVRLGSQRAYDLLAQATGLI